ncbi:HNH endonuclease signature motif containing protein [Rhodococcus sp. OK519]|uniref:HNH endonuclease signature motif containing protein n=1 Tax=Rhodococcus sp. OK519 TaxID=2135729 RepID=UPI000D357DA6
MFDTGVAGGGALGDPAVGLQERHARIAREQYCEIDAVTTLFVARCEEDARAGRNEAHQGEFVHVEVASILGLTEPAARRMIGLGCELRWRLHLVGAYFRAGRIDLVKTYALAEVLANVSDDKLVEIERLLLDGAGRMSTTRLRARARRLIARLDPDGVRERRRSAERDRDVRVVAGEDGMSGVEGVVPAAGGRILAERLRAMAFGVCARDPRTHPQRRADALVALAEGHGGLTCTCGRSDCTATSDPQPRSGVRVQLLVGVNATTLLGLDDRPGFLFGHGPIDADLARDLAADATWRQVLTLTERDRARLGREQPAGARPPGSIAGVGRTCPRPGTPPAVVSERTQRWRRERTYRPGAQLADVVRTRDGLCRFPNCVVPAQNCDIDHTIPFGHENPERGGLTVEDNLACLCRTHHRLKTLGDWSVRQIGGGRLEWADPAGRVTVTTPQGPFADPVEPDLHSGVHPALLARLTDAHTLQRLRPSAVEADIEYLLDARVSPAARPRARRRTRNPGTIRSRCGPRSTSSPKDTGADAAESPPF